MKRSKKINSLVIGLSIILLSLVSVSFINGQAVVSETMAGFLAPDISQLNLTDGEIESTWESVNIYQDISEFRDGGYAKFANNQSHLFSLFVCSTELEWISVEFEPDSSMCMANMNDGWTFYINQETSMVTAKDVNFVGTVIPSDDSKNDLSFESIVVGDQVFIEVSRPFNTLDTGGYDIVYQNGSLNILQFASKGSHFGQHTFYYLLVTSQSVTGSGGDPGENPGPVILPEIPQVVDLSQLKFILIGVTPIGVFGFIFLHLIRRVITSPIQHGYNRIASNSFKPPTFKERWSQTFSTKK
ncbi:MAG: hypothetical protein ACW97X_08660 [Candidatus Hodarchaeales archaeon]|jgi:hypothetical protein